MASRRYFLRSAAAAVLGLAAGPRPALPRAGGSGRLALGFPDPRRHWHGDSSVAAAVRAGQADTRAPRCGTSSHRHPPVAAPPLLSDQFPDLWRHFVFEYYPWYATNPYLHWDEAGRRPPIDIASNYMPRLGAYDSRSTAVLEQHARWINAAGIGAINVSWWGRGGDVDRLVPTLMDVMAHHDIHVTFHLEPYTDRHAWNYATDIEYLITEYGDRRHWDCFLLLRDQSGRVGPVFKSFRTILPARVTDCHGTSFNVPDYVPDSVWRQQTDRVRQTFESTFDRVTLLADSLDVARTKSAGFDGMAIYDNSVAPSTWAGHARSFSTEGLVFSFNINSGVDAIALRHVDPSSCYQPPVFEPGRASYDWSRAADREAAENASAARIAESCHATITLQSDPSLVNEQQGWFLAYINSFNEWHEGHQFEPMKDRADLTAAEQAIGYHNPTNGSYRLTTLADLISEATQ